MGLDMIKATATATALRERQGQQRVKHAIGRLLDRLHTFIRAYPRDDAAEMPLHDVAFVTMTDDGPEAQILDALKSYPELWLTALPDDVCIVSRRTLVEVANVLPATVDCLADQGIAIVEAKAFRHRMEIEDKRAFEHLLP